MLELKQIYYSVPQKNSDKRKYILSDINLQFPDGTTTVITGHNGSGKSTLVKLLMGIENPNPARYCSTVRTSRTRTSRKGRKRALRLPFSNP